MGHMNPVPRAPARQKSPDIPALVRAQVKALYPQGVDPVVFAANGRTLVGGNGPLEAIAPLVVTYSGLASAPHHCAAVAGLDRFLASESARREAGR